MPYSINVFAQTGSRVMEINGNFSYRPPLGWEVTEFPGLKYKVVYGPDEENFRININFIDEYHNGSLHNYVNQSLFLIEPFFEEYRLIERKEFRTNSGIFGEQVIIINRQYGFLLRQTFYFLQLSNNRHIVITCSVLDKVAARYTSIFEESIKTFELIK